MESSATRFPRQRGLTCKFVGKIYRSNLGLILVCERHLAEIALFGLHSQMDGVHMTLEVVGFHESRAAFTADVLSAKKEFILLRRGKVARRNRENGIRPIFGGGKNYMSEMTLARSGSCDGVPLKSNLCRSYRKCHRQTCDLRSDVRDGFPICPAEKKTTKKKYIWSTKAFSFRRGTKAEALLRFPDKLLVYGTMLSQVLGTAHPVYVRTT